METPYLCPSEGHKHGGRKQEKTSGVHFCQKRGLFSLVNFRKFRKMYLLTLTLFRMLKIAGRVILKKRKQLCHSRPPDVTHDEIELFYFQKNARYHAKELRRDILLGNLS